MPAKKSYFIMVQAVKQELELAGEIQNHFKAILDKIASETLPFRIPVYFAESVHGDNVSNVLSTALNYLNTRKAQLTQADWDTYSGQYKQLQADYPMTRETRGLEHSRFIPFTPEMMELVGEIGNYIEANATVYRSHRSGKPQPRVIATIALYHLHAFLLQVESNPALLTGETNFEMPLTDDLDMVISICIVEKGKNRKHD